MGADLYIKSISDKLRKRYEPLFEAAVKKRDGAANEPGQQIAQDEVHRYYNLMYSRGYFRDSYNVTNVLNTMNLSWWEDVAPLIDDGGFMQVDRIRSFRILVQDGRIKRMSAEELKENHATVDDGENNADGWHSYFVNKRRRLLRFLDLALKLNEPIYCSI